MNLNKSIKTHIILLGLCGLITSCNSSGGGGGGTSPAPGAGQFGPFDPSDPSNPNLPNNPNSSCLKYEIGSPMGTSDSELAKNFSTDLKFAEIPCLRFALKRLPNLATDELRDVFGNPVGTAIEVALTEGALFYSSAQGDPASVVGLLFEYGLNPNTKIKGRSILEVAVSLAIANQKNDVVNFLIKADKVKLSEAYVAAVDNQKSDWLKNVLNKNPNVDDKVLNYRTESVSFVQYAFLKAWKDAADLTLPRSQNIDQTLNSSKSGLLELALRNTWKDLSLNLAQRITNIRLPVVNSGNQFANNLLEYSVLVQDLETMKTLIARGLNPNENQGNSFYLAMYFGRNTEIRNILVNLVSNVSRQSADSEMNTYLTEAIRSKDFGLTETLIKKGAPIDQVNSEGMSALFEAASNPSVEYVDLLLRAHANINIKNKYGQTAIFKSANPKIAESLIQSGANIDTSISATGSLLEYWAAKTDANWLELAQKYHGNLKLVLKDGQTLLHIATKNNNVNGMIVLLQNGVDVNALTLDNKPAITDAQSLKALDILIKARSELNRVDRNNNFVLKQLVVGRYLSEQLEMLNRLLLEKPILTILTPDSSMAISKTSLLHLAFKVQNCSASSRSRDNYDLFLRRQAFILSKNEMDIAESLLKAGLSANIQDEIGQDVSSSVHCLDSNSLRLLGKYGANFGKKDLRGKSSIDRLSDLMALLDDEISKLPANSPLLPKLTNLKALNQKDLDFMKGLDN